MINRIHYQPPMHKEKSQKEGKRIMPEKLFTEFPALFVDLRVGISRSASVPMIDYFSDLLPEKNNSLKSIFTIMF